MDQVRAIAKVIWQQRFWVLSVLGLIVAVVCWKMAASGLDAEFASRKGEIDGKFTAMNSLASKTVHPNEAVNNRNDEEVQRQTQIVNAVWRTLYDRQKESVLKWPKELGEQFLTYIERLKFRDPIDSRMRSIYQNYIGGRFKGLLEIVDALETVGTSGGYGGYGGGRGGREFGGESIYMGGAGAGDPNAQQDYLVEWLDQEKLRAQLAFATNKPTSLQIWITQEDLWVYETLLKAIANTNKARGATRPDNAAIRTIVSLEVGAGATMGAGASKGQVYMPRGASAGGEAMMGEFAGEMGGRGGYEAGAMAGGGEFAGEMSGRGYGIDGMGGMGAEDPAALDSALLTNRYVGDDGAPLAGEGDLGKEFRQLPIRMVLVIDQRYIPRLLLECANAPLPIEVNQIRVNADKAMAGFETGGAMTGAYGAGGANVTINDPAFGLLELKGVVFIYNEPTDEPSATATEDGQLAAGS